MYYEVILFISYTITTYLKGTSLNSTIRSTARRRLEQNYFHNCPFSRKKIAPFTSNSPIVSLLPINFFSALLIVKNAPRSNIVHFG